MNILTSRWMRSIGLVALVATTGACGLPRVGPTKSEIYEGSVQRSGDAFVVEVNDRVTRATAVVPALGFSATFRNAGIVGSDTIRPGDTLGITVFENVDEGLLVDSGANAASLNQLQVDDSGFIFVPYAGRIRAAGNTPEAIRRLITEKLETQTPDPQIQVFRAAGDGATVTVAGAVGGEGIYNINRPTRTLSAVLARAGGPSIPTEVAQVTMIRGNRSETIWFEDIFAEPDMDIALRNGDRILVEQDTRAFTALGATGGQRRVDLARRATSALEAIALVGGLNSGLADPTGVFVFRNEPAEIANAVLGRDDLVGPQRMVYVLNLTSPNGMFEARDFVIRDGDTVYVTEAPYVRFRKVLSALTGTIGGTANLANTTANLDNIGN